MTLSAAAAALGRSVATVLLVALFSVAGLAQAAWLADGAGNAFSAAHWMPHGNTPTAGVQPDGAVSVSWIPSVLSGTSLSGYLVRRYDAGQAAGLMDTGIDCTPAACTVSDNPGTGTWQYAVTPVQDQWAGAESGLSAAVTVAPPAPGGLSAAAASDSSIALTWTKATDSTATEPGTSEGQRVHGRDAGAAGWTLLAVVGLGVEGHVDTGLACETAREYRVETYNAHGETSSNVATATTHACAPMTPAGPTSLTATAVSDSRIDLAWSGSTGQYSVERSADGGGTWTVLATVSTPSYSDSSLACAQTHHYRVIAVGPTGLASEASNTASATTSVCPPPAPSNLTATAASETRINLAWTGVGAAATHYTVGRSVDGETWTHIGTVSGSTLTYSDTSLSCGQTRHYRVRAYSSTSGLLGAPSNVAIASTTPCLVVSLAGSSAAWNTNNWRATVVVTAMRGGQPVSGVSVSGAFAGGSAVSCTTGADGTCPPQQSTNISNSVASTAYTVSSVNGTAPNPSLSITISKP